MALRSTRHWPVLTLAAAYLGLFVGLIDSNAVNLALPAIRVDLGGGVSGSQWIADAYNVTFAALLVGAGWLGDRFGRRRVLRVGLTAFVAASVGCALAPTLGLLIAARTGQGLAAALMLPQGLAIAAAAFPDAADRARATGAWAMTAASSAAVGPIVGGLLSDTLGWRFIFWLNVPVGLAALAMSYRYLPESRNPIPTKPDAIGQALAIVFLGTVTLVLVEGRTWDPALIAALLATVAAAGAGFARSQRLSPNPVVPPQFLRNRPLTIALAATFVMTLGTYGLLFVNSLAFQQQRGASALATAITFLPLPLTYLALIPAVTRLARRAGPRLPMTLGLALLGTGLLLYAVVGPDGDLRLLEVAFVLAGAGLAFNTGPAVGMAMNAVPVAHAGLASGVVNLARLTGITVGVAALGTLLSVVSAGATSGPALSGGVRAAVLAGGVIELVGALVVLGYTRKGRSTPSSLEQEVSHA
jgi:MFS transporter, DHA2 family, methylenomycin A resistance protein